MIEIISRNHRFWINKNKFRLLLNRLISHYKMDNTALTLAFVNNRTIKDLNRRFLNEDKPTDVLSFPINEKGPDGVFFLGDIIISAPFAFRQCLKKTHGLERELEYLVIHGFLHLLGFEHFKGMEEEEEKIKKLFLEENNGN
jgi:probable rRNA maturation factor